MGGRDKLLEPVDGIALLERVVQRALDVGPTVVTIPTKDHPRRAVIPPSAQVVAVSGQMSDSIKTGITALPDTASGVVILPADMPDITATDIADIHRAAASSKAAIVRATTADGRAGHPIYFAASEFPQLLSLEGDRGAFHLISGRGDETVFVPLEGDRARLDLDTPEDWAAYRSR